MRPALLNRRLFQVGLVLAILTATAGVARSQGRRGGGGRGGGEAGPDLRSRMELLTDALTLTGDQKTAIKDRLDAAHKAAAPIRAELAAARAALATAAEQPGGDVAAASRAYADAAAAMTELEMRTLAELLATVTPEQKKQGTAAAFYIFRGMFLDDKKWNEMPRGKNY